MRGVGRQAAGAAALIAASFALLGPTGRAWLVAVVAATAALCTAATAVRRPAQRLTWASLAVALTANALGDTVFTVLSVRNDGDVPMPGPPDIFYLCFYPLAGFGLWLLARQSGRERTSLIDASIVAVGAGVVVWQFLVLPYAKDASLTTLERFVNSAYPVGDLILLAFLARLAFGARGGSGAARLLGIGIGTLFLADVSYTASDLYGTYSPGSWSDLIFMGSYLLMGAAALHPAAGRPLPPRAPGRTRLGWSRLALLTGTTLLAPAVAISTSRGADLPTVASAVLFLLVMARIGGLLRALSQSGERRFESLVAKSTELVAIVSGDQVRYASPSMLRAAGVSAERAGQFALEHLVHPDDLPAVEALLRAAEQLPPGESIEEEFRTRHHDGTWRVVAAIATNLQADADIAGIVLNAHDIDQLRRLASFDPLTGLANRSEFSAALGRAIGRGRPLNLLLFDLDGFKEVNDSLGHHAGDAVLVEAAHRLRGLIGRADVVARLGGDEFAVLQTEGDAARARTLAARAIETLRQPVEIEGVAIGVGTSIGIVCHDGHAIDPEELLRGADIALYRAKGDGRGRAVHYDHEMGEPVRRRLELRNALESALDGAQLEVHYQPLFRLADRSVFGLEALMRWHHPEKGSIAPAEFIPAAEESHHIITLGRWVLDQAVHQLALWQRTSGQWAELTMSVNLSPRQLHDPELVPNLARLLEATGIPPHTLVLELTEQAVIDNRAAAVEVFRRLKDLGVRLAVDDYGSGNASISYLRQFPIDELKIDRALIDPLGGRSPESHALVKSIIELARALQLATVAEGIETAEQAAALEALGATFGQGYHLARPADAAATTRLLEQQRAVSGATSATPSR
ncbi:MAG: EAL domain-containing protein [Acidimicrobiales bacterium]|nr:EAL domain-containing protein [Acidimicrobiales bacterium]